MSRKNIFDLLERDYNIAEEADRIDTLFSHEELTFDYKGSRFSKTVEKFFDKYLFLEWEHSNTFLNVSEYREHLGINNELVISRSLNFDECLRYFEYVFNVVFQVLCSCITDKIILNRIKRNIELVLAHFNYKIHSDDKNRKFIIIENNPAATSVAEIVEDDNISRDIIRYNHFILKGNLYEKKKILTQLYKEYEKIEKVLKKNNHKSLADDLGFIFNALGIRHDKSDNKVTNQLVADMQETKLEEWCDRVYDTFLLAELTVNNINEKNKIDWLKTGEPKRD